MRSIVFATSLVFGACDSGRPVSGSGDARDVSGMADASDTVSDAPVLRDTSEVDGAAVICEAPTLEGPLVLGRDDARWCFEPLAADATLTIVHGIQGGIHVEVRLAVTLPQGADEAPPIAFEVEVVHDGTSLARFANSLVHLQVLGDADGPAPSWATAAFPVVFASADASLYSGLHAELRAHVTLPGASVDLTPLPVYLVESAP